VSDRIDLPGTTPDYDQAETVIRKLLDQATAAAIEAIRTSVPFLNAWGIRAIFRIAVERLVKFIYKFIEEAVALAVIEARVDGERIALEKATDAIREALSRPTGGMTDEEQKKLLEEYDRRLRDLIRIPPDLL